MKNAISRRSFLKAVGIMSAAIYQSASQQLQAEVDKVNQSALQQQQ